MAAQELVLHSPQGSQGLVKSGEGERLNTVQRLGSILAASGYFSDVKDVAQAAVKVMAGEELGIAPVAAVMGIHIIKGKVTLSANLIASQVRRHGYNFRHVRFDNTGCVLEFTGKKGERLGESSFTEEDARQSGVYSDMYKKFPRNMYFARAVSNGAKWYCPEVMSGLPVYVPEELGVRVDSEGDIIHDEPKRETPAEVAERRISEERAKADNPPVDIPPVATASAPLNRGAASKPSGGSPAPTAPKPPAAAAPADDPKLTKILEGMKDIPSIEGALATACDELGRRMGEEAALVEFNRLLKQHGTNRWQSLKGAPGARAFMRDLWNFTQSVPDPDPEPPLTADELAERAALTPEAA